MPFEPQDRETLAARLTNDYAPARFDQDGDRMTLGVTLRASGALIGDLTLMHGEAVHGTGEIGWMLNPEYSGQGYATEAATVGIDLLVGTFGLRRVVARIDARNTASIRLAQRLGMRQEAHLIENEWFKGEWTDEVDFAILAREWNP